MMTHAGDWIPAASPLLVFLAAPEPAWLQVFLAAHAWPAQTLSAAGWTKLDSFLVALMLFTTVISWVKGFTRELISLGALVWGFLLAAWFYRGLAYHLTPYARTENVAAFTAFFIILLTTVVLGGFVSQLAGKMVDKAGLRGLDRLLGAGFGLVRGFLYGVVIVLALTVFPLGNEALGDSRLGPYFAQGARVLVTLTPGEMRDRFRRGQRPQKKPGRSVAQAGLVPERTQ